MEVGPTAASSSSPAGTGWLDVTLVTCTDTVTFTEVLEEEEWKSFYYSFKTEQLVTLWILFIVTIAGNAIVLFSTWRRKRKSRMTFFVTQLAITDSFTGLINIMTDIIWRYTGDFMAPDIVCRVVRYLQVVLLYASTYVLVSLSIDRYHAIVYPMKFMQGERQAKVLIGVAWSLSFLFSIPTLIIFGKRQLSNGEVQCWALWPDDSYWIPYMTVVAFLVYFIPLIIISVIYSIVIRTIWMKSKAQAVIVSSCTDGKTSAGYTSRGFISRAKVKAIKYSIVIVLAFALCWSPYFLFDILDNFNILPETKERFYASVIIQNLPALNSAINPLIYCLFSNHLCTPFEERRTRRLEGTFRDRSDGGQEMQVLSKPEYI
ncbi:neuropeptide S receptor isoform X2 [Gallus gallus]|uniref:Neuropeptide S receptor n=1 Tax=Gallus gallus TaxID=9031 RepID=A0A1D5PKZ0_CHICK|nr:neuropeptide S receptor isoform X2 [Gallus gallus]XP_426022.2 neuropeptide S receptor isoform X2 [Gallus gallus]AQZ59723.1 neuropeptide S receptor [Gallus gallus]|eukprot:XP_426022.2 neuropeptide S receptor isoform X2 [Gallus gallus]